MFRKHKTRRKTVVDLSQTPKHSLERTIVSSVEKLDIDLERFVVVGSAALILYGIAPSRFDHESDDLRPGDVDLTTDSETFYDLASQSYSPSGVPIRIKSEYTGATQQILRANPDHVNENLLPVDIITRFNPDRHRSKKYDEAFQRHFAHHALAIPGTSSGLRVASPEHIERELVRNRLDPKAASDLAAFRQAS